MRAALEAQPSSSPRHGRLPARARQALGDENLDAAVARGSAASTGELTELTLSTVRRIRAARG